MDTLFAVDLHATLGVYSINIAASNQDADWSGDSELAFGFDQQTIVDDDTEMPRIELEGGSAVDGEPMYIVANQANGVLDEVVVNAVGRWTAGYAFRVDEVGWVTVCGMQIVGEGPEGDAQFGVYLNGADHARVSSNIIRDVALHGVAVRDSHGATVSENRFFDSGNTAVDASGSRDIHIATNFLGDSWIHGVSVHDQSSGRIEGNVVHDSTDIGIYAARSSELTIVDN